MLFLLLLVPIVVTLVAYLLGKGKICIQEFLLQEAICIIVIVSGYYLPGGRPTTSLNRYIRAYRKLSKAVVAVFGSPVNGFDPGISIVGLSLNAFQAIKVWEYVNKKKWRDQDCK